MNGWTLDSNITQAKPFVRYIFTAIFKFYSYYENHLNHQVAWKTDKGVRKNLFRGCKSFSNRFIIRFVFTAI